MPQLFGSSAPAMMQGLQTPFSRLPCPTHPPPQPGLQPARPGRGPATYAAPAVQVPELRAGQSDTPIAAYGLQDPDSQFVAQSVQRARHAQQSFPSVVSGAVWVQHAGAPPALGGVDGQEMRWRSSQAAAPLPWTPAGACPTRPYWLYHQCDGPAQAPFARSASSLHQCCCDVVVKATSLDGMCSNLLHFP